MKDHLDKDDYIIKTFREGAIDRFSESEKKILRNRIDKSISEKKHISLARFYWVAAAIIVLFGVGYVWNNLSEKEDHVQIITHETGNKERVRILLPDSTVVFLNARSRIEYRPSVFTSGPREVKLTGEAYFDVKPSDEQAFVVLTGQLQVNVLGTQFTVSDYQDATIAETVLISGKVNVRSANDSMSSTNLLPDEQFLFNKENQDIVVRKIDASQYTAWVSGRLYFDNAELGHIVSRLEQWYGKKIKCPEDMKTRYRLTFTVRNEDISQILQLIQNALPVQFEQTGNEIMIHEKNN